MARSKRRDKIIYREVYKPYAAAFFAHSLPTLRHLTEGSKVVDGFLLQAGTVERDGREIEFHDMRVFIEPTPPKEG